jgi:hypothetical protein
MTIFTHNFVSLNSGLLGIASLLWGGNAIQSISIGRHTPRTPNQAIGYLGVIDWSRGMITSDVSLDCILTEQSAPATANQSAYRKSKDQMTIGTENYVLTSCSIGFSAGQPATVSYGYLTASIAAALDLSADPDPVEPDSNGAYPFAVVLGDSGHGCIVQAYDRQGNPLSGSTNIPYIDSDGVLQAGGVDDGGIPFGLSSINFAARINRDNVMDVRTTSPVQFVSTYPVDISTDLECYTKPGASFKAIKGIEVRPSAIYNTNPALAALTPPALYCKVTGLEHNDEQEGMQVGRYRQFTANYSGADLWLPIEATP